MRIGLTAARPRPARLGLGQQRHGAVHADLEHALVGRDRLVLGAMLDVGPEAADAGQDLLAVLGMRSELARQRQQRQRLLQGDLVGRHALQQRLPLGLLLALGLAELDVEAVGAVAQGHRLAGHRIDAQELRAVEIGARGGIGVGIDDAELAGEAALRIVRAADEGAELAELQAEPAVGAGRAVARALAAIVVGREEVRARAPRRACRALP